MYKRTLTATLARYTQIFPVICITGPRRSGKTTLAKMHFAHLPYVSLEDIDTRTRALEDPRSFLAQYQDGAIFDEIQNAPDLLSYLQGIVDESPIMGRYVITGSQNFALSNSVAQSLAGRVGMTTLLPLSMQEFNSKMRSCNNFLKVVILDFTNAQCFLGNFILAIYEPILNATFEP